MLAKHLVFKQFCGKLSHRNKSLSSNVSQLYCNGFIPFCVYTTYFTLPILLVMAISYEYMVQLDYNVNKEKFMPLIKKNKRKASQIIGKMGEIMSQDSTQQIINDTSAAIVNTEDPINSIQSQGIDFSNKSQENNNDDKEESD